MVFELLDSHPGPFARFKAGENLQEVVSNIDFHPHVETVGKEAHGHLEAAKLILEKLEVTLSKNPEYQKNSAELKTRIEALELIISYMALRQH